MFAVGIAALLAGCKAGFVLGAEVFIAPPGVVIEQPNHRYVPPPRYVPRHEEWRHEYVPQHPYYGHEHRES
jgi:hypothetical protein